MLKDMEPVFIALEIDYYVVGAVARDIHLSADQNSATLRKTNDVDLAILVNTDVQFKKLKQALERQNQIDFCCGESGGRDC